MNIINRELSWLDFNSRILDLSRRPSTPLKERFKFLSISSSNLDEFLMVRLPTTFDEENNDTLLTKDVYKKILKDRELQDESLKILIEESKKYNIEFVNSIKDLDTKELKNVEKIFKNQIYPFVSPIAYDSSRQFPLIKSKELAMIIELEDERINESVISVITLSHLNRFFDISEDDGGVKIVRIETILEHNLKDLFIGKKISSCGLIKILRNSNNELKDDEDIYIVDRMKKVLYDRERNDIEYVEISNTFSKSINKMIRGIFNIKKNKLVKVDFPDISSLINLPIIGNEYRDFKPQFPNSIVGSHDMLDAIDDENDIVLHHPYHSFTPIINLLEHAAEDPDVVNIKQTLYRVSSEESPIVKALCKAARNGKDVVVMLELKARFDEHRNIEIIESLKDAGVKVVHGPEQLKTHCKAILITKRTPKGVKYYSHIGTGNYSENNAKVYTDISYFTNSIKIGEDLLKLFNALSGYSDPTNMKVLKHSPYNLRNTLIDEIDKQVKRAEKGETVGCIFKVNSLADDTIIKKIYDAASKGVEFILIVRGICCIRPTNNIKIKSIVGRFLEHSRIYYFINSSSKLYISSADLLTRNLDKRIELLTPLKGEVKRYVVDILLASTIDDYNSYILTEFGWNKVIGAKHNSHEYFMNKVYGESKLRTSFVLSQKKR